MRCVWKRVDLTVRCRYIPRAFPDNPLGTRIAAHAAPHVPAHEHAPRSREQRPHQSRMNLSELKEMKILALAKLAKELNIEGPAACASRS